MNKKLFVRVGLLAMVLAVTGVSQADINDWDCQRATCPEWAACRGDQRMYVGCAVYCYRFGPDGALVAAGSANCKSGGKPPVNPN